MKAVRSDDPVEFESFLARARKGELLEISNRKPWQTRCATLALLSHALEKGLDVCILAGTGGANFFDAEVCGLIGRLSDRGEVPRMLVWQENDAKVSMHIKALSASGKLNLRLSGTNKDFDKVPHFLLVGQSAYRQEAGHPEYPPEIELPEIPARICFSDLIGGQRLRGIFDILWHASGGA